MAVTLAAAARKAEADATANLLNSGHIEIFTGSAPDIDTVATGTKLAALTFNASAFIAATDDGTNADAEANAIVSTTGITDGVAGYYRCWKADNITAVIQGTITGSGGGGDMELGNTSIATGQTVAVTSFIYRKTQA